MRYGDALAWLYGRQRFGVKLGLETIRQLLDRMGNPQDAFAAIHVTGTNGKGSVAALLDACLRAAGHKVGLYTSPHLVTFRERLQVDGEAITEEDLARGLERLRPHVDALEQRFVHPTYFECVTALAFDHFRQAAVPVVVLEAGLGGRLDATNVCRPLATVVTNVGLDHTDQLGTSIQAIAAEKAGIFKPGVPALTGARREALDVVARKANELKVPLRIPRPPDQFQATLEGNSFQFPYLGAKRDFRTRLLGDHQVENAVIALATLEAVQGSWPVPVEAAQKGLAAAVWPGRLEIVERDPLTLLDGAHNAPAMEALARFLERHFQGRKIAACVGVLREKAATRMLRSLSPFLSRLVLTRPPSARALGAAELEDCLPPDAPDHTVVPDPREAFRTLLTHGDEPVRLITGSLFLVGEARAQILRLERDPPVASPLLQ